MSQDLIIMTAGKGTRLKPLTDDKPKAMVNILGKPIIQWIFESVEDLDLGNIYLITGYRYNIIEPFVKTNLNSDVRVIRQNKRTGTANAINLTKNMISDDFLVLSGDTIFKKEDLKKLSEWDNSLLYTEQKENLFEFGTLDMEGHYITHINEKSTRPTSYNVNCSAYHFNKQLFDYIPKTPVDKRFGERIVTNTINLMIDDGYKFGGIKIDELNEVTRPKDIYTVEQRLLYKPKEKVSFWRKLWKTT